MRRRSVRLSRAPARTSFTCAALGAVAAYPPFLGRLIRVCAAIRWRLLGAPPQRARARRPLGVFRAPQRTRVRDGYFAVAVFLAPKPQRTRVRDRSLAVCRFSSRRFAPPFLAVATCTARWRLPFFLAPRPQRTRVRRRSGRECAAEAGASAPPSGRSPQHTRVRRRGERECAALWAVAARAVAVFPLAEAVGVSVVTLISVLWSVPPPLTAVRLRWGQSFEGMAPGCCPIRRLVLCRRLRARVLATEKVICGSGSSKFSFVWEFREFRSPR